jgi:hypothetical protein
MEGGLVADGRRRRPCWCGALRYDAADVAVIESRGFPEEVP